MISPVLLLVVFHQNVDADLASNILFSWDTVHSVVASATVQAQTSAQDFRACQVLKRILKQGAPSQILGRQARRHTGGSFSFSLLLLLLLLPTHSLTLQPNGVP